MFRGRPSCTWNSRWSSALFPSIPSAAGPPASAASTVWTWSGCAWPSQSSLSVSSKAVRNNRGNSCQISQPPNSSTETNPTLLPCSPSRLQLCGDGGGGRAAEQRGVSAARRRPEWDPGASPHGFCPRVSLPPSTCVQWGESPGFIRWTADFDEMSWCLFLSPVHRLTPILSPSTWDLAAWRVELWVLMASSKLNWWSKSRELSSPGEPLCVWSHRVSRSGDWTSGGGGAPRNWIPVETS